MNGKGDKTKAKIALGGTARKPEDVEVFHDLKLDFAELPIDDLITFKQNINKYLKLKEITRLYYLCHGPREGNPHDIYVLNKDYKSQVSEILEIMPMLSMSLLTLHLWMDRRFVKSEVINFKTQLLETILGKAQEKGITVCLENLSEDWRDLKDTFEKLPLLNLTLDVGHAQLLREQNTSLDFIQKYPDRIRHIHLHDNLGGNAPEDDLHLPPGKGIIDLKNIFSFLSTIGYAGTVTLELKPFEIKSCLGFVKELLRPPNFF